MKFFSSKLRDQFVLIAFVVFCLSFVAFGGLFLSGDAAPVAATISYQTVDLEDGTNAYTTTTYTSGYMSGEFAEIILQVNSDISPTGTLTVTPQFSNDSLTCGASGKDWADATVAASYTADASSSSVAVSSSSEVTVSTSSVMTTTAITGTSTNTTTTTSSVTGASTFSYGTASVYKVLTGDGNILLTIPVQGKCGRIKFTTSTTFTPTVFLMMAVSR